MLTRPQQILLKRAQAEAGVADGEYRDLMAATTGMADCRSSKDARLTDAHLDNLLSLFEAIYWRSHEAAGQVFKQPNAWSERNQRGNTSRDRFLQESLNAKITAAEEELFRLGFGAKYCAVIRGRVRPFSQFRYLAALERTLESKRKKAAAVAEDQPF